MTHRTRRQRLLSLLAEYELAEILVTDLVNLRYLTGFTGSSGAALIRADGQCWLATDGRYDIQAAAEAPDTERLITRQGPKSLLEMSVGHRVGFEDDSMTVAEHRDLKENFDGDLVGVADVVRTLRMVKDAAEIELLRLACGATDEAFAQVLPSIRPGVSELQVARWLDEAMRTGSADGPGFDTIVASGPNSAIPHHQPTDRVVAKGDLVKMDFGAWVGGYHADMTRTVIVGKQPDEWQREIYTTVASAQQAGTDALHPGATGVEVDAAARQVVELAGYASQFTHGLGHGVGLQIHEAPFLGATSVDTVASDVPLTIEPGIYLPGRGGVRIEDTIIVYEDRVEPLTTTTRELLVLD